MRAQIAHACTSAGRISDIHGLRSPVLRQREAARARTRPVLLSWPLWPSEWNSQWEVPCLMADSSHRHAPQAMISRHGFLNLSGDVCFVPCYFRKNEHDFRNCNTFSEAITKLNKRCSKPDWVGSKRPFETVQNQRFLLKIRKLGFGFISGFLVHQQGAITWAKRPVRTSGPIASH